MKSFPFLLFTLAIILGCSSHVIRTHSSKPISLQHENLTHLKNSQVAKGIKKAFKILASMPAECPKCAEPFQEAFQYLELYKKSFLTVEMEPHSFGGYFVLVVFKNHPKVYRLWMYDIDEGEFQLREIVPLSVTLNKRLMDELDRKVYAPYWLQG